MKSWGWRILVLVAMPLLVAAAGFGTTTAADTPVRNGHFYATSSPASGDGFRITDDGGALFWQGYQHQGGLSELGRPISRRFICGSDICQATERAVLRWLSDSRELERVRIRRELASLGSLDLSRPVPDGLLARDAGYIPPDALQPEELGAVNQPDMPAFSRTAQAAAASARGAVVKIEVGHDEFGSGVIFDPRGYVLTNHHVVAATDRVKVVLSDGHRVDGIVVGSDAAFDVAVVKIEEEDLPGIAIGTSSTVREGDEIVVIGYTPLLEGSPSVRTGVVRFARQVHAHRHLPSIIQTDAFVHPGDSGGPLLNLRGELIGLVDSMSRARDESRSLRSNALPIDSVMAVAGRLLGEASYKP